MIHGFWIEFRDRAHERRCVPLAAAIEAHVAFPRVARIPAHGVVWDAPQMAAPPGAWDLPDLPTPGRLGEWLGLEPAELEWLADRRDVAAHYVHSWRGSRLVEAPRRRLKAVQRRIAGDLLSGIPAHDAAHGFRRGRSRRACMPRSSARGIRNTSPGC